MTDTTPPITPELTRTALDSYQDGWSNGYAAARRYYGDTAPLALDKIRARLADYRDGWRELGHAPYPSGLVDDLQTILDTATEPDHA